MIIFISAVITIIALSFLVAIVVQFSIMVYKKVKDRHEKEKAAHKLKTLLSMTMHKACFQMSPNAPATTTFGGSGNKESYEIVLKSPCQNEWFVI